MPQGKVTEYRWESKIYEGRVCRYYVYVPAQYDLEKPAALMVFQVCHTYLNPKGRFRATVVMDNPIHSGELPITIGVFVDPGHTGPLPDKPGRDPRPANRSIEYDTVSDVYTLFLEKEILPEVAKDNFPSMIRKSDPKPLRVYLQGGEGDLDNQFGHWPLANQEMAAALKFKGYDHQFLFGTGGHNDIHGAAVLPDAMAVANREVKFGKT